MTEEDVLDQALKFLQRRDYLSNELKSRLESKGYPEDLVDKVLQLLLDRHIIDDQKTIQQTIERASGRRPIGRNKLVNELVGRGLPEEIAENISFNRTEQEEVDVMVNLLHKKGRERADRTRYGRFLLARGFELEQVEIALDRFFGSPE